MPVAKPISLFPLSVEQAIDLLLLLKAASENKRAKPEKLPNHNESVR